MLAETIHQMRVEVIPQMREEFIHQTVILLEAPKWVLLMDQIQVSQQQQW